METSKNQADSTLDFPNQFVVIIFLTLFFAIKQNI
jgi:hypothetical protein